MNTFPVKAVIFDLDGTILDTLADLTVSVNYALAQFSCPPRTKQEVRSFLGNGMKRLLTLSAPTITDPAAFQKLYDTFAAHYKMHCLDNTFPYKGIPELLQELRDAHVKTAVVSNKGDFAVQEIISARFPGLFDYVVGERPGISRKPAPDTVLEALRQLNAPKETAVYIGDSDVDIDTARNCGMPSISVLWGFRDHDFLMAHGATTLISRPKELLAD